jgi:hypothetical protein
MLAHSITQADSYDGPPLRGNSKLTHVRKKSEN